MLEVATTDEQEAALGDAVETARGARSPRRGNAAHAGRGRRALRLTAVPQRHLLPRMRDRAAGGLARALRRRGARRGRRAPRAHTRRPRARRSRGDDRRDDPRPRRRARDELGTRPRPTTSRTLAQFRSYVVLTQPVRDLLEELGWRGGEAIADGRMFLHYFRTTNDGRVLMGSAGGTRRHAERGLRLLLPSLAEVRVTHHWGGPIDVSAAPAPHRRLTRPRPPCGGVHRERRRPDLACRAVARVARARRRRRVVAAAFRRPARPCPPAPSAQGARRRDRPPLGPRTRGSLRGGQAPSGRGTRRCGAAPSDGNAARSALGGARAPTRRKRLARLHREPELHALLRLVADAGRSARAGRSIR